MIFYGYKNIKKIQFLVTKFNSNLIYINIYLVEDISGFKFLLKHN